MGFLIIYNPMLVINNIFVKIFVTYFQVECDEPLICELVILHFMAHLPSVH